MIKKKNSTIQKITIIEINKLELGILFLPFRIDRRKNKTGFLYERVILFSINYRP